MKLNVNGREREFEADPDMPLLWALRDLLGLRGTKYGCGISACGACTVHLNGEAVRSCVTPVGSLEADDLVTTIEGLAEGGTLHPVQAAWVAEQAPQCGYCQSGQIMQAVALLAENPDPTDDEIHEAMNGNLCRCGAYDAIRSAIRRAAGGELDPVTLTNLDDAPPTDVDTMITQSIGDAVLAGEAPPAGGFDALPETGPAVRVRGGGA